MFRHFVRHATVPALLAVVSLLPVPTPAQGRDTQEVNAYVLTEAGLAKYAQAARNLAAAAQQDPRICEGSEANGQSIDQMAARLNASPQAKAAIRSAGMTTREYVVFSWSLLQTGLASWGLSQPGGKLPPGASMANVKFYRAHEAAIGKINAACTDGSGEEEDAEE